MFEVFLNSLAETELFAQKIATEIKDGCRVLNLNGDLGSGKTTFCRYLVKQLNGCENAHSPTFTLMNEYVGTPTVFHFDFYRLDSEEDLLGIDIESYLPAPMDSITVIEWGNKFKNILPEQRIDLDFFYCQDSNERLVKFFKWEARS